MFEMDYNDEGFDMDEEFGWGGPPKVPPLMKFDRNDRYGNAYGNYRGGYPPSGMSGPPGGYPNFRPPRPPLGPPMNSIPPLGWGGGLFIQRQPRPRQPMEDKITRYLMRCGVPKDTIKNFPRKLLQMFEPDHCGLCLQTFESFADSRLHYVSKGHIKNQRKWLSKQDGGHRQKEIPLKSRDLYCELCDIHITSKQHADSHYEGKPHRSIVEGRKEPRNKALTFRNMQERLQQLIRREKKFIKPLDSAKIAASAKLKENKDVPAELYCNICKTAVTCSEQMTAHLNGKRHLGKEKQHILKVMKGEVDEVEKKNDAESTAEGVKDKAESTAESVEGNKDTAESTAENVEGNEMEVKDDGEGADNEQDDFDWGKDSESWEETTVKED